MNNQDEIDTEAARLLALSDEQVMRETADEAWAKCNPPTDSYEAWIEGFLAGHKEGWGLVELKRKMIEQVRSYPKPVYEEKNDGKQ